MKTTVNVSHSFYLSSGGSSGAGWGATCPSLSWVKQKKSQKEEKRAGQATPPSYRSPPSPPPPSRAQGLHQLLLSVSVGQEKQRYH